MSVATHRFVEPKSRRFVLLAFTLQPATDIQGVVAFCPALGVASQGATPEEAENNIREAVGLYLTAIDDDGDLDRVFAEKGLTVSYLDPGVKVRPLRAPTVDGGQILAELVPVDAAA
jgi:predicted RNase H-like HicB family nuclease